MKDLAIGLFGDALSAKGVAVTGGVTAVVSAGINKMLSKRHKLLQEIVRSEIRQGKFERVDEDELISIFFRLIRDAEEGVARNNLRLMARIINGMVEKQKLKAPSFLRYANILASLTDKEIRILSVMIKYKEYTPPDTSLLSSDDEKHQALMEVTQQAEGHMQALMRTGLVNMVTDKIDYNRESTNNYRLTKLMDELLEYLPNIDIKDKVA
jgi:hypothetical protein